MAESLIKRRNCCTVIRHFTTVKSDGSHNTIKVNIPYHEGYYPFINGLAASGNYDGVKNIYDYGITSYSSSGASIHVSWYPVLAAGYGVEVTLMYISIL